MPPLGGDPGCYKKAGKASLEKQTSKQYLSMVFTCAAPSNSALSFCSDFPGWWTASCRTIWTLSSLRCVLTQQQKRTLWYRMSGNLIPERERSGHPGSHSSRLLVRRLLVAGMLGEKVACCRHLNLSLGLSWILAMGKRELSVWMTSGCWKLACRKIFWTMKWGSQVKSSNKKLGVLGGDSSCHVRVMSQSWVEAPEIRKRALILKGVLRGAWGFLWPFQGDYKGFSYPMT